MAWWFVAGLGLVWLACSDSGDGSDLFTPAGTGGSGGVTTGYITSSTSASSTSNSSAAGGSAGTGSAGSGGAAGSAMGGASGATAGGGAGAGGTVAGSAGAGMSGAGGRAGAAGAGGISGAAGGGGSGGGGRAGAGGAGGGSGGAASGGRGGGGTGGGGGVIVVDAGSDAGQRDIHCGTTFCTAVSEFCCIPENGQPRCVAATSANTCPDSAAKVRCDDRTDCPLATQVCCAQDGAGPNGAFSMCRAPGNCNGPGRTEILCDPQDPSPCGPGGGTNVCRTDNQTIIMGYPSCH